MQGVDKEIAVCNWVFCETLPDLQTQRNYGVMTMNNMLVNKKIISLILLTIFLICIIQSPSHGGFLDNIIGIFTAFIDLVVDIAEGVVKIAEGVANLSIRIVGTVFWDTGSLTNITPAYHDGGLFGVIVSSHIHLWDALTHQTLNSFTYTSNLTNIVFSLDGLMIASGSDDNTVQLWDPNTLQLKTKLIGHTDSVLSVSFSPDGSMLASAGADGFVKLWNPETFQNLGSFGGHTDTVRSIKFSPNGSILASADNDHSIRFWNPQTQTLQTTLVGHTEAIWSLAFSTDGSMLASASEDGTVRIWNTQNNQEIATLDNESSVYSVDFIPGGKLIVTGTEDGVARLWDPENKTVLATLGHKSPVKSIAFDKTGSMLITGSADNKMRLWKISEETEESKDLISNRTLQVRTTILSLLRSEDPTISGYSDITAAHLANITTLNLNNKNITSLKVDDFDGLTNLQRLRLDFNRLTSLPAGIFDDNTSLSNLNLYRNQLSSLPDGIFEGKTSLTTLRLGRNAVDPLPLFVSLEKVAEGQFKAVAPTGATFNYVLPITVTNGSINGGITTLMIPHGSVESGILRVTRTVGTTDNVTVNIGTLPNLPRNHYGYALVKSNDLPLEVISATATQRAGVNIPDANLRAKIESALGKTSGDPIAAMEMATLASLTAQDASISNLTGLEAATNLTHLHLWNNNISDISPIAGLTKLTHLSLHENTITDISNVANLTNLIHLRIGDNTITDISAVANLTALQWLDAQDNNILDISDVTSLNNLITLTLSNNSITDISSLTGLTNLLEVALDDNAIADLSPLVSNTGFDANTEIYITGNPLSYPSIYTHIPALQAKNVYVDFDNRVPSAPVKISGDTQSGNTGTALTHPFVVEVQDASRLVFEGVPVTFAVTTGGGSLSVTNTTTNDKGRAQSTLTLGNTTGTNTVRVSITGTTQTITFTATAIAPPPVTVSPILNRTQQVQDAIVAALPGIDSANHVTAAHLASLTSLDLSKKNISALKEGDFDGMTSLINLYLNTNQLTSLPENLFAGLTTITQINLHTNRLTSLPKDLFSGLPSLRQIFLHNNRITSLHKDVFSGLSKLESLYLDHNQLTSLHKDLFSGLSSLTQLLLNDNQLTMLPEGLFRGLTGLKFLHTHNSVDPIPLTISLEKVNTNKFKATAPTGAPFTTVLPIDVLNGWISSGTTTVTIPSGNTESQLLTVNFTLGIAVDVTVDIGTLPGLPANHKGYALVKSTNLPLTIFSASKNIAPVFTDGTTTIRTIAENTTPGANIGLPVSATDADNDTLIYSLGGTDAASFAIDTTNGQLQTLAALDYETKSSYNVTVTVSDGSLTDTITVTVNITDIDESPTDSNVCKVGDILAPGESCTYPDSDAVFSVLANGHSQWNIPNLPSWLQWINRVAIGGSMRITATVNNTTYHFVAESVSNKSWEIKEIGDDTSQQPVIPDPTENPETAPTLTTSTAAPLTESALHGGIITLNLSGGTFERSKFTVRDAITLTGISGVTVDTFGVDRVSDTQVTVELEFDGNMTSDSNLTISLGADAIKDYDGAALTAQIAVSAFNESVTASPSTLTEATLDGSEITLTLSGRKFERSILDIRDAVSVSGISGVTFPWHDPDKKSDTEITVKLDFDGDMTSDGTLTFTVGADAIAGYNGSALTAQISVAASRQNVLLANFPNPFNPETWIPYQLAKDAEVTLHIYAVNGTLVRTLFLGHQAAGIYQTHSRAAYWDGKNEFGEKVVSGVYFYTLTAGDFTATRKMLILK